VSAVTGAGLDELRLRIDALLEALPEPETAAPVRLWIDRAFTVRGAGTVVTGTLGGGRIRTGDELQLGEQTVRVRGLQSMGAPESEVAAVARVAVNLRGVEREAVGRGDALLTPGRFRGTDLVDVRVHGDPVAGLPATVTLHVGSAAVPVRVPPLGEDTARLRLAPPLPLRIGDRALLRDPGRHHVAGGVTVLDVVPPGLSRRGAAAARAAELSAMDGVPDLDAEVARRRLVRAEDLDAMGVPRSAPPVVPGWYVAPALWADLAGRVAGEVADHQRQNPLEPGMPVEALRRRLGLPDRVLVEALVRPPLTMRGGRVAAGGRAGLSELSRLIDKAFDGLEPLVAPEANDLTALGLGPRQLAAAVRVGLLIQLAPQVVLRAGALDTAKTVLSQISGPFTLSEARRALNTTRRVAVPLLELLDRTGVTRRHPDDRRTVT
jgi:selenocysteine-specific elongation factor